MTLCGPPHHSVWTTPTATPLHEHPVWLSTLTTNPITVLPTSAVALVPSVMRSLLVLAALVPCVEALMLTCTPRPRSAKFVVVMLFGQVRRPSSSTQLQSAQRELATMSRLAKMSDIAIEAKDMAIAAKDDLIDTLRMRTPQNHPLLGRPRVTLSCLSRVRVACAETYQKDLSLSKQVAILHCRSVVELTATIFCQGDAKINTFSGMINKFLNGQVRGPTRRCSVRCRVHSRCPPPPCPINLLCSLLSSLSHPAGLQERHQDADEGRRRHARDAG